MAHKTPFIALALLLSVLVVTEAMAGQGPRGAAPYVEAYSGAKKLESLPLAMTRVDVVVAGVIADVRLSQTYENRGDVPIEAVYVFPASERATVYGLTMTVGKRIIRAKLDKKAEARRTYETARGEGRTATLLEQKDVGAFRMNVANVLPGESIKVELSYTEMMVPTKGVYEFFFPNTAPAERYTRPGDPDIAMTSSAESGVTDYAISLKARILSAAPIASIDSPSHRIQVVNVAEGEALVTIEPDDIRAAARDFVLRYSMLGDDIGTGVLAYESGGENFFLLTAQPPRNVGMERVPPREYIFVLDVSGSMSGRPMDVAKQLMRDLFRSLRSGDRLNVVLFAGGSKVLSETGSLPATPENLQRALKVVGDADAGGGTELAHALEVAYALPKPTGMARSLVVVTDGAIAAGSDVSRLISHHLDQANVFVFGIGEYLDRSVIARIARAGAGEQFLVARMDQAEAEATRLREYIERPVLTGITLDWAGADLYDLEPAKVADLFSERPIVIVGKFRGRLAGSLRISGHSGTRPATIQVDLGRALVDSSLSSLPKLWARRRIDRIEDSDCVRIERPCSESLANADEREQAVTEIALRYGVMSNYTSFVAVTEEVRAPGEPIPVNQPVPARDVERPFASSGYGFAPGFAQFALTGSVLLASPDGKPLAIGGRLMLPTQAGWRDVNHHDLAHVLRIRRDSPAFERLMALVPELAPVFALSGEVLVSFGAYSILITPHGFSDYPESTLRAAVFPAVSR